MGSAAGGRFRAAPPGATPEPMASLAAVSALCPAPATPAAPVMPPAASVVSPAPKAAPVPAPVPVPKAAPVPAPEAAPAPVPAPVPAEAPPRERGVQFIKLDAWRAGRFSAVELEALAALGVGAKYVVIEEAGAEYTVHAEALGSVVRHLRGTGDAPSGIAHTVDTIYVPQHITTDSATAGDLALYRIAECELVKVRARYEPGCARWALVSGAASASKDSGLGAPARGPSVWVLLPDGLRLPAIAAEPDYPAESWPFLIALGRFTGVGYVKVAPCGGGERLVRADALTEAFRDHPEWLGTR